MLLLNGSMSQTNVQLVDKLFGENIFLGFFALNVITVFNLLLIDCGLLFSCFAFLKPLTALYSLCQLQQ